jgi:thiol-disulfide isomerase/thioredoxin
MGLGLFRTKRRTAVSLATAAAVLLAGGLTTAFTGGGGPPAGETYVTGSPGAVLYDAGHRPLVPDFAGASLTGQQLNLKAYRGKVLVINQFGSWCGPCRAEGPALARLSGQYKNSKVAFVGVDVEDTPVNALAFEHGYGITYPSFNDPGQSFAQVVGQTIPITGTPTTLVIDRTGHLAGAILGTLTYPELNSMLARVAAP